MAPDDAEYWRRCLAILRNLKIVDPACGSGAFLFQAYDVLEVALPRSHRPPCTSWAKRTRRNSPEQVPTFILQENLYGVDLSPEAVEITQLALWIRSASPGQLLAKLSENIVHGNSLVHDPAVHPAGFDWRERFPDVFSPSPSGRGAGVNRRREARGFDCVIGNPPWERMKLQEREFFSLPAPEIATATNAAKRRQLVAKLEVRRSGFVRAISAGIGRGGFAADLLPDKRPIPADRQRATSTPTRCSPNWPTDWSPRTAAWGCSFHRASRRT